MRKWGCLAVWVLVIVAVGMAALLYVAGKVDTGAPVEEEEPVVIYDSRIPGSMLQNPDYPAGCEIVTLVNALDGYGVHVSFDEAYAAFDKSDDDFVSAWWGDPYTEGAAYPPAMVAAANRLLDGTAYEATDISGASRSELEWHVEHGSIVIAWHTTDGLRPCWTGWVVDYEEMYSNEHCMAVYAVSDGLVHVSDPLVGLMGVDEGSWMDVWEQCGSMAVAIVEREG